MVLSCNYLTCRGAIMYRLSQLCFWCKSSVLTALVFLKGLLVPILLLMMVGCASSQFDKDVSEIRVTPSQLPSSPVALVISDSAIEMINKISAYNSYYKDSWIARIYAKSVRLAYVETSEPSFSVRGVTQMLERKFGEVHQFRSLDDAANSRLPLIVVLDFKTRLINSRESRPASYLSLEFKKPDGIYLGKIYGKSERVLTPLWANNKREHEIVVEIRQQGAVQREALEQLERRLEKIPLGIL